MSRQECHQSCQTCCLKADKEAALKTSQLADAAASVAALEAKHTATSSHADVLQRQCAQLQDGFFR